jgi:hypothetical protein
MFLEIFFALVIGWLVFSYYCDSNLDDIINWIKNILSNILYHQAVSQNQIDIGSDEDYNQINNDGTNIIINNNLPIENQFKINQYDELLELAMKSEVNYNKNDSNRITPKPERNMDDDLQNTLIPIKSNNNTIQNIPIDTNNESSFLNENKDNIGTNEPSFLDSNSSLGGASLV